METAVRNFLVDVPQAAVIWLALLVVAVLALALLGGPTPRRRPEPGWGDGRPAWSATGADVADSRSADDEARRYAEEVAVAAGRAVATAARRRAEWLTVQDAVEAAWRVFEAADEAVRRLAPAAAIPEPRTPRTPAEFADRERYLHHAATAACRRKEISVHQLSDALGHRNGWDPRRHPVQQEIILRRVARAHLLRAYRLLSADERAAWHAADVAAAAARSLQDEAFAAAVRVLDAGSTAAVPSPRRPGLAPAGRRPHLVTR